MNKKKFLLLPILLMLFAITSCKMNSELIEPRDAKYAELYLETKNEITLELQSTLLRSNTTGDSWKKEFLEIETTKKTSIDEYIFRISNLSVTNETKSFLYSLPLAFATGTNPTTIKVIESYPIPIIEKELLVKAIAMTDAIIESEIYTQTITLTRGVKEYNEAIDRCLDDYYEDLGIAVGEALVAGGIAAYGGPHVAGVTCAVVGIKEVAKAYRTWRKCKSRANELK